MILMKGTGDSRVHLEEPHRSAVRLRSCLRCTYAKRRMTEGSGGKSKGPTNVYDAEVRMKQKVS